MLFTELWGSSTWSFSVQGQPEKLINVLWRNDKPNQEQYILNAESKEYYTNKIAPNQEQYILNAESKEYYTNKIQK